MGVHDIDATIERRLLVNVRVDPDVAASLLPHPFEPRLVGGYAVAGLCLIHLSHSRPAGVPRWLGRDIQGMAHRIAVTWPANDGLRHDGVYIPRRYTSSRVVAAIGGASLAARPATFRIPRDDAVLEFDIEAADRSSSRIRGRESGVARGLFADVNAAQRFFEHGGPGFTPIAPGRFRGVGLVASSWEMTPVDLSDVQSAWFSDTTIFPPGSAQPDSAFVMRRIDCSWRTAADLVSKAAIRSAA